MPMPHMYILQCPDDMNFLIRCVLATKDPAVILVQQNVSNQTFYPTCTPDCPANTFSAGTDEV